MPQEYRLFVFLIFLFALFVSYQAGASGDECPQVKQTIRSVKLFTMSPHLQQQVDPVCISRKLLSDDPDNLAWCIELVNSVTSALRALKSEEIELFVKSINLASQILNMSHFEKACKDDKFWKEAMTILKPRQGETINFFNFLNFCILVDYVDAGGAFLCALIESRVPKPKLSKLNFDFPGCTYRELFGSMHTCFSTPIKISRLDIMEFVACHELLVKSVDATNSDTRNPKIEIVTFFTEVLCSLKFEEVDSLVKKIHSAFKALEALNYPVEARILKCYDGKSWGNILVLNKLLELYPEFNKDQIILESKQRPERPITLCEFLSFCNLINRFGFYKSIDTFNSDVSKRIAS